MFLLQLTTVGFSELSTYFCRFGLKQCVEGLLSRSCYTCYERKRAYEFLECLGLSEDLHSGVECASQEGAVFDSFFHCLHTTGGPVISYLITTKYV